MHFIIINSTLQSSINVVHQWCHKFKLSSNMAESTIWGSKWNNSPVSGNDHWRRHWEAISAYVTSWSHFGKLPPSILHLCFHCCCNNCAYWPSVHTPLCENFGSRYTCIISSKYKRNKQLFLLCASSTAPSSPPINVGVSNLTSSSLNATWEPPLPASRNGVIIGYFINVTVIEDSITIQLVSSTTSLVVNSLEPFTSYTIAVAAQTTVATGPYSQAVSVMTMEDGEKNWAKRVLITLL